MKTSEIKTAISKPIGSSSIGSSSICAKYIIKKDDFRTMMLKRLIDRISDANETAYDLVNGNRHFYGFDEPDEETAWNRELITELLWDIDDCIETLDELKIILQDALEIRTE